MKKKVNAAQPFRKRLNSLKEKKSQERATEKARAENDGLENDGQTFSNLRTNAWGLENAGLQNSGPC